MSRARRATTRIPSAGPPVPRELQLRARRVNRKLARAYPDAHCALHYSSPLDLYVATVLSAQCTDERVNKVTPGLFARCRKVEDYLSLGPAGLEEIIRSTGFFRAKARNILAGCQRILEVHDGEVPRTLEELVRVPGCGRKTANVILGNAFDTPGITVDTHMGRIARRLELTTEKDPVKVEADLQRLLPEKEWTIFSHRVISHGRAICDARKPVCGECPIRKDCPYPESLALTPPLPRKPAGAKKGAAVKKPVAAKKKVPGKKPAPTRKKVPGKKPIAAKKAAPVKKRTADPTR